LKLVKSVLSASIIAAAVSTATAAEFDIYGSIQPMYDPEGHRFPSQGGERTQAVTQAGIKLTETLTNGISLSANYEIYLNGADWDDLKTSSTEARQAHVGLSGDFGTVKIGRTQTPSYMAVGYVADMFYWYTTGSKVTASRQDSSIFYNSPDMDGLNIAVAVSNSDDSTSEGGEDRKDLAVTYKVNDNITLAASHVTSDTAAKENKGIAMTYTRDSLKVMVSREDSDAKDASNIFASYTIDDKTSVAAHYADLDSSGTKTNPWVVAGYRTLTDDLTLWVEYTEYDGSGDAVPAVGLDYRF